MVALVAIAAACGNDTVDSGEVEAEIERDLSSSTAEIVSVSCPEGVEQKEGEQFSCDAKLEGGGRAEVTVRLTSNRGDAVYSFTPGTVEVSDSALEPVLEDLLEARGVREAQVDCPELIKVADGSQATCDATAAGGAGEITFTWSDSQGGIDEASVDPPTS
jgi:hypothetical protein